MPMSKLVSGSIILVLMLMTGSADAAYSRKKPKITPVEMHIVRIPGTDYKVDLNAATISPSEAMLTAIETWLSANFGLPLAPEHPRIQYAPPSTIATLVYGDVEFAQSGDPEQAAVSAYSNADGTIYLPHNWSGRTPAELSILAHEVVHHMQNLSGA